MLKIIFFTTHSHFKGIINGATIRTKFIWETLPDFPKYYFSSSDDYLHIFKDRFNYKNNFLLLDHLQAGTKLKLNKFRGKTILNLHNLESELFFSISKMFGRLKDKFWEKIYLFNAKKLQKIEKKLFQTIDYLIFPSFKEAQKARILYNLPQDKIFVIPNPAPHHNKDFIPNLSSKNFTTLSNPLWFPNKISYQKILKNIPYLKGNFQKPNYNHSLSNRLKNISLLISLGLFAGGTKIKILTGMALGIPQVITNYDLENLDFNEGDGFLLATNLEEWRKKINLLLQDEKLRKSLSLRGKDKFLNSIHSPYNLQQKTFSIWKNIFK